MKKVYISLLTFAILNANAQIPNTLSSEEKIYGLSRFWQEVNYNFVYLEKVNSTLWDSTYREMIKSVQRTRNDYEYYREIQRFCALLKDGHTNIHFPGNIDSLIYENMFGDYRIILHNIDDKAIITHVNHSKRNEIPIGSEIIEVNGLATAEYMNQFVLPYISSSTEYILRDQGVKQLLAGLKGEKYKIKVKTPEAIIISLSLIHEKTEEKELYPPYIDKELFEFKWYDKQIAYMALNSFRDTQINSLFIETLPKLCKARGIIIDLRSNEGGNTRIGTNILQYLTADSILYGARSVTRNHIPAYKAWGRFVKPGDDSEWSKKSLLCSQDRYYYSFDYAPDTLSMKIPKIEIPTVLLIGHNTISAAEDFLIYTDNQEHMIKIGQNSCGSTGEAFLFDLPGGGNALVCTKKDIFPDGREFVGSGVKPDIEVKLTLLDFLQEKDPALEEALKYLQNPQPCYH